LIGPPYWPERACSLWAGELEAAHAYVKRASEIESELQFHARYRALLLYVRGSSAQRAGDWNTALDFLRSGLDLAGGTPDGAPVAALCCQQLAEASVVRGDMSGARDWAARALELSSTLGFPQGRGLALLTLGTLSHQLGDLTAAQDYLEASAAVGREFGQGGWWVIYAHLAATEGRGMQAMRLAGAAEQLRIGARRPVSAMERALQERWLAPARAVIGESASESAFQDGLSLAENLRAFALRDLAPPAAVESV